MNDSIFAAIGFGLTSAAMWGSADFSGGLASKRLSVYGVAILSQAAGYLLLLVMALLFHEPIPPTEQLAFGFAAGLVGMVGLVSLYKALSMGEMNVAAPLTAILAASIPVLVSILTEGAPDPFQMIGFPLALTSIWFLSRPDHTQFDPKVLRLPLLAGLAFGFFFTLLERATQETTILPLIAARTASLGSMLVFVTLTGREWRPKAGLQPSPLPLIALCGVLDALGNIFYAFAAQIGRLDVAAVLGSLYPAATVLLAWWILRERITRQHGIGVVLALSAIVLIAL